MIHCMQQKNKWRNGEERIGYAVIANIRFVENLEYVRYKGFRGLPEI